jgi:magnesium chelatase subunit D
VTGDFLPFSAVVGQDEAKLALLLTACDRRIGGVLLRGDKGSAKSTLARGMAALLPGDAPFVDLPIGATEDRVVGTLDLAAALTGGEKRFDPGLLHAADGGVLYVDEINLLPDHLVDVLLDVAASGVNRIEREGVSHTHPSRFVLIGSMNPEEGELRPQLLDRFGLAVDVRTPGAGSERAAALHRRLAFDADRAAVSASFGAEEAALAERLAHRRLASMPPELVDAVAAVCSAAGAEGLRADLTICRATAALAGWEGRTLADGSDVRRVAPLALAHRARRDPLDAAGHDQQGMEDALDEHLGPVPGGPQDQPEDQEEVAEPTETAVAPIPAPTGRHESTPPGRRAPAGGPRGRTVGDRKPVGSLTAVAVGATVRQAVSRRAAQPAGDPDAPLVETGDLRQAVREHRRAHLIVIAVDASGSMGASQRMETAKGAVIALLRDAYQRRDRVALVSFRGDDAEVLLRPTSSVEVARARLAELPTGGRTPLAAGIRTALRVASAPGRDAGHRPLIVLITDARATTGPDGADGFSDALAAAGEIRRAGVPSVVIDVEATGRGALGPGLHLGSQLAAAMAASHIPMEELTASGLEDAVRRAALR